MSQELILFISGLLLGTLLGACIIMMEKAELKKQSIEKGFAEYNQQTGAWQWKEVGK